jgi:alanine-synthesizing transaminase
MESGMSRRLNPLETARRRAARTGRLIDFSVASFSAAGLGWPEELYERAWRLWREDRRYTPSGRGGPRARSAVAAVYTREGLPVDPDDVVLTAGSSVSYQLIFSVLRRITGSTAIALPLPGYPLFEGILNPLGMEPVWYHCPPERGFLPQMEEIEALLTDPATRPAALVLISPNNPAGITYPDELIAGIAGICEGSAVPLIVDEVFSLYRPADAPFVVHAAPEAPEAQEAGGATAAAGHYPAADPGRLEESRRTTAPAAPVIHLNGLSKLCAAPEIKLGWIVLSGGSPGDRAALTEALDTEHDTYLTLSGLGEAAAVAFLEGEAPRRQWEALRLAVEAGRKAMVSALAGLPGVQPASVDSGIHVPFRLDPIVAAERVGSVDDEAIAVRMVEDAGVLVHPGYFYGLDYPRFAGGPWFVASSLITADALDRGIEELKGFFGE